MLDLSPFPLPFALMGVALVFARQVNMARVGTVYLLFLNWAVCETAVDYLDDFYPVLPLAIFDWFSFRALRRIDLSGWVASIMALYGLAALCHLSYAIVGVSIASTYYGWRALTLIAWGQTFCCGAWGLSDYVGAGHLSNMRKHAPPFGRHGLEMVAQASCKR